MNKFIKYPKADELLWREARSGKFTSSEFSRLSTKPKSNAALLSTGGKTYAEEIVVETLTGWYKDFSNEATEHGNNYEQEAIDSASILLGQQPFNYAENEAFFELVGRRFGGTPDATLGENFEGVLEVKCPFNPVYHLRALDLKSKGDLLKFNKQYYWQILCNCFVVNAPIGYFVSYNPKFPDKFKTKILEVPVEEKDVEFILDRLDAAETYVESLLKRLQ